MDLDLDLDQDFDLDLDQDLDLDLDLDLGADLELDNNQKHFKVSFLLLTCRMTGPKTMHEIETLFCIMMSRMISKQPLM